MKESYDEGVASHIGPESCLYGGNAMPEALTGGNAGRVLSLESNGIVLSADVLLAYGRQHRGTASARCNRARRGRRPHACMETFYTGCRRSRPSPRNDCAVDGTENPKGVQP